MLELLSVKRKGVIFLGRNVTLAMQAYAFLYMYTVDTCLILKTTKDKPNKINLNCFLQTHKLKI